MNWLRRALRDLAEAKLDIDRLWLELDNAKRPVDSGEMRHREDRASFDEWGHGA